MNHDSKPFEPQTLAAIVTDLGLRKGYDVLETPPQPGELFDEIAAEVERQKDIPVNIPLDTPPDTLPETPAPPSPPIDLEALRADLNALQVMEQERTILIGTLRQQVNDGQINLDKALDGFAERGWAIDDLQKALKAQTEARYFLLGSRWELEKMSDALRFRIYDLTWQNWRFQRQLELEAVFAPDSAPGAVESGSAKPVAPLIAAPVTGGGKGGGGQPPRGPRSTLEREPEGKRPINWLAAALAVCLLLVMGLGALSAFYWSELGQKDTDYAALSKLYQGALDTMVAKADLEAEQQLVANLSAQLAARPSEVLDDSEATAALAAYKLQVEEMTEKAGTDAETITSLTESNATLTAELENAKASLTVADNELLQTKEELRIALIPLPMPAPLVREVYAPAPQANAGSDLDLFLLSKWSGAPVIVNGAICTIVGELPKPIAPVVTPAVIKTPVVVHTPRPQPKPPVATPCRECQLSDVPPRTITTLVGMEPLVPSN